MTPDTHTAAQLQTSEQARAERTLVASFLVASSAEDRQRVLDTCQTNGIASETFIDTDLAFLYTVMLDLVKNDQPSDALAVLAQLKQRNSPLGNDPSYLEKLIDDVPTTVQADWAANQLRESYLRRRLANVLTVARNRAFDLNEWPDATALAKQTACDLDALGFGNIDTPPWTAVVDNVCRKATALLDGSETEHVELPTGLRALDALLNGGFMPGQLVLLAARPSVGKTSLAMNMAETVARSGKSVLVFSLEMDAEQLAMRMFSNAARVNVPALRVNAPLMLEDEKEATKAALAAALAELKKLPLVIDDSNNNHDPAEIRVRARRLRRTAHVGLVVIDYLQLCSLTRRGIVPPHSRNEEISIFTREFKAMARELKVPVVLLSQLRRPQNRKDNEELAYQPVTLDDLRDSGAIEQDADVVMLLQRKKRASPLQPDAPDTVMLKVAKNRNGKIGEIELAFDAQMTRFSC